MTSLGITICQGLVYACGAWKDFDRDILNSHRGVEDLAKSLEQLQAHLRTSSLIGADLNSVHEAIEGCGAGLQSLKGILDAIKGAKIPVGPRKKAWLKLQRAIYPFSKDTVKTLQGTVATLQCRLNFALEVYQT